MTRLTLLVSVPLAIAVGSPALAENSLEKILEGVGHGLEKAAAKLHSVGITEAAINAAVAAEAPEAEASVKRAETAIHQLWLHHEAMKKKSKQVSDAVASANSGSGVQKHVDEVNDHLEPVNTNLDALVAQAKERVALARRSLDRLAEAAKSQEAQYEGDLDDLFQRLETRYPKWKDDLAHLEKSHEKAISTLVYACQLKDQTDCGKTIEPNAADAAARLERYHQVMDQIEKDYGGEISDAVGAFIGKNSARLTTSAQVVSHWHADFANALHSQVGMVHDGLDSVSAACCKSK